MDFDAASLFSIAVLTVMCVLFVFTRATRLAKPNTVRRRIDGVIDLLDELSVERGGTGNLCLAACLNSKQSLSQQHVRDALVLLAKRQPMLRAIRITEENGDKYFEVKEISEVVAMLDITSSDVKSSEWKDVWFEYTAKQLGNGLLWRVVMLQEEFILGTQNYANTLMFTFNHSITDGVSSINFCKQFLGYMNELANGATVDKEVLSFDMQPYFHDAIAHKRAWHVVLKFLLTYCGLRPILRFAMKKLISREFRTMKCNPYYAQFPPALDVSSFAGPMRLKTKVFTEQETKNILQACKVNRCTVTGALTAAANLAFCELIRGGLKENEAPKIQWEFAINAKRFCDPKPSDEYIGYYVYMCEELFMDYRKPGASADFWKLAQENTVEIRDNVKAEGYIVKEALLFKLLTPKEGFDLVDRETLVRISSCNMVSSMGSFEFGADEQKRYELKECFVNVVGHGYPVTFSHHNHTINGKMGWLISYDASRVQIQHAETFANLCFGRFIEIAAGRV